jgi:molybdopterin-guanine dinucleotide biosynthesis protein A
MIRHEAILQPLPGIFRIDAAQVVRERLAARQFSIGALTRDPRFAAIELGWDPNAWQNINTPDDSEMMRQFGLVIE